MDDAPHTAIHTAFLALGANLPSVAGPPEATFRAALAALGDDGVEVAAVSRLWRSAAWPDPAEPPFLNAAAVLRTTFAPRDLLARLHGVERRFGRRRDRANAPRTLDLDLIAYDDMVIEEVGLVLPHPRAHERRFVMGPLAQISPAWRHPVLGRAAADLAAHATVGKDAAPIAVSHA